jgi:hypothetical protein
MSLIMGDLRAALVEAGASDASATKAASEVATYEARLASIDTRMSVLTWMTGFALTFIAFLLAGEVGIWQKLGEVGGKVDVTTSQIASINNQLAVISGQLVKPGR